MIAKKTIVYLSITLIVFCSCFTVIEARTNKPINYAVIPQDWKGGYYLNVPQYVFVDNKVTYQGHISFRVQSGGAIDNFGILDRSIWMNNSAFYPGLGHLPVSFGDKIVFSAYLKLGKSNNSNIDGGRIGIDYYGNGIILSGAHTNYVHWNNYWSLVTLKVTVPNTVYTHDETGASIPPTQIDHLTVWVQATAGNDSGIMWISNTQLYKNP